MRQGCGARRDARAMARLHVGCWPWHGCWRGHRARRRRGPQAWTVRRCRTGCIATSRGSPDKAEGLAGLLGRSGERGPKPRLSPEQEAALAGLVRQGPDLAEHGVVRWRRTDLARVIAARFGVVLAERSVGDVLRRLGFRRLVTRPQHSGHDAQAQRSGGRCYESRHCLV